MIATNVGGIPCILTHESTGLLVPVNDHKAMAQAAFRLLDDPDLVERITGNARQEVHAISLEQKLETSGFSSIIAWRWASASGNVTVRTPQEMFFHSVTGRAICGC